MKRPTRKALTSAAAGLLLLAAPLLAHHGTANFDLTRTVTVEGTVKDFQYINPHVQIYFECKDDKGQPDPWQAELTAPTKLARAGWTKHTLKPGDKIIATGNPAKSGAHTLWLRKLTGPAGELQLAEE